MGKDQESESAEVCLRLISRGLIELNLAAKAGDIVDPYSLPDALCDGMSIVSRLCIVNGTPDIAASVHVFTDMTRRLPVGEWGVPAFAKPFKFAESRLLTEQPAAPTEECHALTARGAAEDAYEEIHHRQLRELVQRLRQERRTKGYSTLREKIVRSPVYERRVLSDFLEYQGLDIADEVLRRWSLPIPLSAIARDGSFNICRNCGSLLYPHRDRKAFPDGRCRISACLEEAPSSRASRSVPDPTGWRVFTDDILAYWVGPGLAEIKLYDELRAADVDVEIYPRDDAADVGKGFDFGIDVKSYSCPRLLGEVLSTRLGGLTTFDRRFVAIPDSMVDRRPRYLEDLRDAYTGTLKVTFAKVGDIRRLLAE